MVRLTLYPVRTQHTQPVYGSVPSVVAISKAFGKYYRALQNFSLVGTYKRNWHCQNQTIRDDIQDRIGFEIHQNFGAMGHQIEKGGPQVFEVSSTFEENGEEESYRPGADYGNHAFRVVVERLAPEYSSIEKYH